MAQCSLDVDSSGWMSSSPPSYEQSMKFLQVNCAHIAPPFSATEVPPDSSASSKKIPTPPPLPEPSKLQKQRQTCFGVSQSCSQFAGYVCIPQGIVNTWDKLFEQGYKADVHIHTDGGIIPAHSNILGMASPVMKSLINQQNGKSRIRSFNLTGVPYGAARTFIRFLYSSRCDQEDMEKFSLQLLVLSHVFAAPTLKSVCTESFENGLLTTDNVIDVLQLARLCDAARLTFLCTRFIVKNFKTISKSEGWKVMQQACPDLEQELLGAVVEADSRKQERLRKIAERKIYLQLYDAMEALVHICRDGCRTIGPYDKELDENQGPCNFPACKGLESLIRHFAACKTRVPGGCLHCKRMWQLLELHSRMCSEPDACRVPLCRHFKEKRQQQTRRDDIKWKVLVSKVTVAKRAVNSFSSPVNSFSSLVNSPLPM